MNNRNIILTLMLFFTTILVANYYSIISQEFIQTSEIESTQYFPIILPDRSKAYRYEIKMNNGEVHHGIITENNELIK